MRSVIKIVLLCLACAGVCPGQVVDRVVATVNGQPILQSDWDVAMRCEALLDDRPLRFTAELAGATLQRLVDQELLRQQIRSFQWKPADEAQVRSRVEQIRKQVAGATTESGWNDILQRYGLTPGEMEERLVDEAEILRFIDARLRPTVHVDRRSVEAYYYDKFLPELNAKGAKPVPLNEVSPKIQQILLQQLIDAQLAELLRDLRQQSEIHIDTSVAPAETAKTSTPEAR